MADRISVLSMLLLQYEENIQEMQDKKRIKCKEKDEDTNEES